MDAKVDAESLPGEKVSSQEKTLSLLHCHNLRRNQVKRFLAIVTAVTVLGETSDTILGETSVTILGKTSVTI